MAMGNAVTSNSGGVNWCPDDIKAFEKIGIELKPYTVQHSKKE